MSAETRGEAIAALTAEGEPYATGQILVRGEPSRIFRYAPASPRGMYEATTGDATFFIYGYERLTFAEAFEKSNRLARRLREQFGVAKGNRVAIAMRSYPE